MSRAIFPLAAAFLLIISLSLVEGVMRDRWAEPGAEAAELGERFKNVPMQIGDWQGENLPVDEVTRSTAGAVRYVSRRYVHNDTQNTVRIWLIVGHSRDVLRHTPNICYPNQGFRAVGSPLKHPIEITGQKSAEFYTAKYSKEDPSGRHAERVFWAWNHPDNNRWEAPDSRRTHYGLVKALYKLYFVSNVGRDEDTVESNVSIEFMELMLPALSEALFPEEGANEGETTASSDSSSSEDVASADTAQPLGEAGSDSE
ncbi:MAG: EpsI family protein [Pirellulales bacterium]|nr:EpsI family protein [Pirellulales bacterium]